ncbi:hypothetical protein PR202_ga13307 [Eleusine coracana subsp. coracana]|uniref:PIR2-like helical domain-containing protein n=1 Tax=Eleusine coracana subsp. coracana TaxID=191504 RepID=A0AAV5CDY4_ELECO|nr:hypothetical protein PR202_ga13307 [Eleusine coracana subsp. coracana]
MVTFLICYFRNLPVIEALQYLLMFKADLLATVHLIVCSRGMGGRLCPISSPAMEMALRYAAISASHPRPAIFAAKSLSLALRLEQLSQILTTGCCLVSSPGQLGRACRAGPRPAKFGLAQVRHGTAHFMPRRISCPGQVGTRLRVMLRPRPRPSGRHVHDPFISSSVRHEGGPCSKKSARP